MGSVVKVSGATLNLTGNVSSNGAISCGSNAGGVTSSLDVTGVTVTVGAAQAGGGDVDFTVAPGAALSTFISTGSTFIFSGTNAQALNSNSLSFNNLQVGATGALTLSASITLTGDLSNNLGGSLNTTANSTTVTFAPTGLSTAYNVLHPGLSASPAAMISGTNTFFNFTCNTVPGATLYFTSGNTTTVNNAWTIAGTSGNLVSLLSSNFGSQWTISIAGTSSVSYAYVQDSSVSGANNISPTTSTNAGNNKTAVAPRWIFSAGSLTWVGATSNNWNVASNWDLGYIPGPEDNVTISGSNPAKLFSAVSVSSILITTGTLDLSNFNLPLLTSSGAAGSFTLQAGGTLLLDGGQATLTFGSAPVLSGTVEYYGTGTTGLILGNTYVNLEFANAGTWTLNAPLSITGTFSYPSGSPKVKLSGNNMTVGGSLTAPGTLDASGGGNVTAAGNVDFTGGTFTSGAGAFIFDGTSTLTTAGNPFSNVQIGTATVGGSLALADNLTLTGTLTFQTGGATTLNVGNVTVTLGPAALNMTNLTTFTTGGSSTFVFDGTTSLTSATKVFNNIEIGNTTTAGSLTLAGNLTLTGAITVGTFAGSVFNVGGFTVTVGGNVTLTNLVPANFTSAGSTFIFDGTSTLTTAGGTFSNVQIGTATVGGSLALADNLTLTGTLTFQTGGATTLNVGNVTVTLGPAALNMTNLTTFTTGGSSTFVFDGTTSLTSATKVFNNIEIGNTTTAGSLTLVDNLTLTGAISIGTTAGSTFVVTNRTVTVGGNVTLTNLVPANFTSAGSTFIFDGTSTLTTAGGTFNNVQIGTATVGGSLALADNLTLTGTLTFQTGGATTLNVGNVTVTLGPAALNMTNLTTFTTGGSSTFVFDGTTSLTSATKVFNNIEIGNTTTAGSLTLVDNLTLTGAISIGTTAGSTFVVTNRTVTVGGNVTFTASLTAFTSGGSTFIFDGSSTLTTAGGTFSNVQIGTATVGGSLALADNLTLTGTLTFQTGGATTLNVGNVTVTLGPAALNMTNLTTFTTGGSSTFVFDGTTSLTSATKVFNNIEIGNTTTAGSLTLAGNLTLTGAITVGTFAGSVFNVGGFTVTVGGNVMLTNLVPANFTSAGSTFIFDGTSTLTTAGGTFNNIEIGNTTTAGSLTLVDNLTLTGAISIGTTAGSTFVVTNRTVTVGGNVTLTNLVPANFTSAGSTFIFDGTSTLTTAGGTFNNVQIGTATVGGSLALADNLTLTGTLTFQTGGATTLNVGNVTVTLGPAALNMTNLTTFTTGGSSTFVFDGTTSLTSATKVFNNIEIGNTTTAGSLTLVDNLTLTGAISIGTTAGSTFVVTNRTVTVGGNVTFTASLTAFTSGGSTFIFDGTTTLASTGKTFNNIQVGTATLAAAVTLGDNAALANASGVLSMTQGALDLNGHTLVLGTALNMNSATVAQITVGTGTLDGTTNGRAITISSAQATITQTAGTLKAPSLTVSNGTYTQTGALAGTVTLGTGGLTQTGGTITANVDLITSSGNVAITGGTFNQGSSTLTMDTGATTVQVLTPSQLANLTIGVAGSGAVSISTDDLTLSGNLDIISSWTFNTNALNLTVGGAATVSGTLNGSNGKLVSVTGDTTCSGTINLLNGNYTTNNMNLSGSLIASGSETITVNGGWNRNGGTFTPVTSTVQFAGAGTITGTGRNRDIL